jgi:hypothetical protein
VNDKIQESGDGPDVLTGEHNIATTGDGSGNLAWGFTPEELKLFPEIEVNYSVSLQTGPELPRITLTKVHRCILLR